MSKLKKAREDSNGSISSSGGSNSLKKTPSSVGSMEKKNLLSNQTRTSRKGIRDSFRDAFTKGFEIKDDEPASGSSSGGPSSGSGGGGVTFATTTEKPVSKPRATRGSTLMILSPDRRRGSKGPTIQPLELLQLYRAKEATFARQQPTNSSLFPYKWISPNETPPENEQTTPTQNLDSPSQPKSDESLLSPIHRDSTSEKSTGSIIVASQSAHKRNSCTNQIPSFDQMFVQLDMKLDNFLVWQADMQTKLEDRKKKAQREKQQLQRTASTSKLIKSTSIIALATPPVPPSNTTSNTGAAPAPTGPVPPSIGSIQSTPNNTSGSNLTQAQLTARRTSPAVAASIASSLGFQKFNELTELERSFTRLKLTINPLWLLKKKLQLATEYQQQEQAAANSATHSEPINPTDNPREAGNG